MMHPQLFKISKLKEEDIPWINEVIKKEFPYTTFSKEKLSEKIDNTNFFLIKHHQKNISTGFLELEFFLEEGKARLNAIFVEEAWRGQGIAKKLLKKAIHECKRRKEIHSIFLLVKEDNFGAKKLYEKIGFVFEKIHDKEIDNSIVEVWSMHVA